MGYTQYFYKNPRLDKTTFRKYADDVEKVLASSKVAVAWECDEISKKPETTSELIRFNGIGNDGHETFYFDRMQDKQYYIEGDKAFGFCKTARKPYDVCVVACLILAKKHFGNEVEILSDGGMADWQAGLKLVKDACGYDLDLGITEEGKFTVKEKVC